MVLAEALGEQAFLERVKIYATDVDEEALDQARQASYTGEGGRGGPARRCSSATSSSGDQRYAFRKDLRRTVIFGRNDLVQDAPISRIDLLMCRNTLMYFNAETQARILGRFHFALNPRRLPVPGQVGDADHARRPVHARSTSSGGCSRRCRGPTLRDRLHDARARDAAERRRRRRSPDDPRRRVRGVAPVAQIARRRGRRRSSCANEQARSTVRPLGAPTSGGRSRTSRSPTGRSSCARTSSVALRASAGRSSLGRPSRRRRPADGRGRSTSSITPLQRRRTACSARRSSSSDVTRPAARRGRARALQARARERLRGAAVDGRGARDDQRGAPVDQRGARDDQRGAPVDQRGARDDERGAPVDQRGARDDQRRAAPAIARAQRGQRVPRDDPHEHGRGGHRRRPRAARPDLERRERRAVGPARRRGGGPAPPRARHRPAGRRRSARALRGCSTAGRPRRACSSRRATGAGARSAST